MATVTSVFFLPALLLALRAASGHGELQCAFTGIKYTETTSQSSNGTSVEEPKDSVITCPENYYCFSLWTENKVGNQTIISQGCWETSGGHECAHSSCTARQKKASTLFCCCSGNFCNVNLTNGYVPPPTSSPDDPPLNPAPSAAKLKEKRIRFFLDVAIVGGVVVIVILVFAICASLIRKKDPMASASADPNAMEGGSETSSFLGYSAQHLKLLETIGQGRYGCVWRGTLREKEVAVKIFPSHYRNFFINERDIYSLPFMEHPALLTYFGCDERPGPDGGTELMLVLSYAPHGCLQDYLRNSSIDWATFCRMSSSVSSGLAHLHTEFIKIGEGAVSKPCVGHRDLNTRNILVKPDLSCCICDLGLAMKISGSKYFSNGEEQRAETKSLNDVGTLRYMAPEVLEGAVNLRDCESSLKQIDVYALGLVLWELATRCSDLYMPGLETPPYKLPFEAEIGLRPTFEDMQVLVSRRKSRPLLPDKWRDGSCMRLLRETIEDCWDQDAEARLTALCVDERLKELPIIWERQKGGNLFQSGISPTVNLPSQPAATINNNNNNNNALENNNSNNLVLDNRLNLTFPDFEDLRSVRRNTLDKDVPGSTGSEGTVETIVTLSPSDPPLMPDPTCKNALMASTQPVISSALQPYQGRNPCLERNLMVLEPLPEPLQNGTKVMDLDAVAGEDSVNESHALLSHDSLQQTPSATVRPATPIPYLQNAVFDNDVMAERGCPKQPNVPGNGRSGTNSSRWSRLLSAGMRVKLFGSTDNPRKQQNCQNGTALLLRDVPSSSVGLEEKTSNLSKVATRVSLQQGTAVCRKDGSPSPPRPSSLNLSSAPSWLVPPAGGLAKNSQNGRFSLYENNLSVPEGPDGRATSVPDLNC